MNPLGAVVNGVDLMRELGAASGDDLEMVGASAGRARDLLAFHRLAFGLGAEGGEAVARAEIARLAEAVLAGRRVEISIGAPDGPALPRPAARLALLMALAGRGLLGMSGRLMLELPPVGALPLALTAEGTAPRAAGMLARLSETGAAPEPEAVEFHLLPHAAEAAGAALAHRLEDGRATLTAAQG